MHSRTLVFLAFLSVLQLARTAQAGPVEQLNQVAFHPKNPDVIAVRYFNGGDGMFFSNDRGKSWKLTCDALLVDPVQVHGPSVPIAIAGDGTTLVGVFNGIWHDDGHGCSWKTEPKYDGEWFGDITEHPTDPDITFAVTSTATPQGQPPKLNGVIRRDASGAWSDVGKKEQLLTISLDVVARSGGGLRYVVGAVKGETAPDDGGRSLPNYVTRVSDDDGQTWHEYSFGATDGSVRIQGVDPSNPDRIVASINRAPDNSQMAGADNDTVLVSTDGGAHFKEYLTITEIGGVAFAPDGRVWIGDLGSSSNLMAAKGLWSAPSLDKPATKLAMGDYPVQCLGYQKASDTLYACQRWSFGSVKPDDGAFTQLFKLTDVKELTQCSGVDSAATCQMQLCTAYCGFGHFAEAPLCSVYSGPTCGPCVVAAEGGGGGQGGTSSNSCGGGTGGKAGGGAGGSAGSGNVGAGGGLVPGNIDAGADGGTSGKHKSSGCSCTVAGARAGSPALLGLAGLVAAVLLRRRRR